MSAEETAAVLVTTALSHEKQVQALVDKGLTKAEAEAALATAAHSAQNVTATATTGILSAATSSLKTALKGLWATLAANPILLVVGVVAALVAGFARLSEAEGKAAEKAKEVAETSREKASKQKEELGSIDELIAKYKELANSDVQNADTRNEIKKVQDEITKLVGTQADNLNLVNGKLDEELEKLYEIRKVKLGDTVSSFEKAYVDSRDATDKYDIHNANWVEDSALHTVGDKDTLTIDYWGDNKNRDKALEIINKDWKENDYGSAYSTETTYDLIGLFYDTYSELKFNSELSQQERIEALDSAIAALKNEKDFDYSNNGLWQKLVEIRDELGGTEGLFTKQAEAAQNLLDGLVRQNVENGKEIKSLEDYRNHKKQIEDSVKNNDVIKKAIEDDVLSEEGISAYIENYLAGINKYEDFYINVLTGSHIGNIPMYPQAEA